MFTGVRQRSFANGVVYALRTNDNYLVEVTDTFLPAYTKDLKQSKDNTLTSDSLGCRSDRWMIGVSTMSGCPVGCMFCATGSMKKSRNLTAEEIVAQVDFVLAKRSEKFVEAFEHKVNYTRMGEPFLNIENVRAAIDVIGGNYPRTHHYVSTIGVKGSDFSWIKGNITLQISVHSLKEDQRNLLIPFKHKMSLEELASIETQSDLKTTVNMTLVDTSDFDITVLKKLFNPANFFIKLSPINPNEVSNNNNMGEGVIKATNII